ncbi:DUF6030 family protein [Oryzifoliimicrobium ureilyticus]|uniref:DUF6030 family protein n=1 Tax=Oryzifoliimicrobium ureilyticus TaxID=3113724 RepID=UPI0030762A96
MLAVSLSIVCAIVLLSNDMRHLRSLLYKLGLEPTVEMRPQAPAQSEQQHAAPTILKQVPRRLISAPSTDPAGSFIRSWRLDGKAMCSALREAGIEMTEWRNAELSNTGTRECFFQHTWNESGDKRSVFYLVRGNAAGTISSIRVKLVNPALDAAGHLDKPLVDSLQKILEAAAWQDFEDVMPDIAALREVRREAFGASMTFTREISSKSSFNFIVALKPVAPERVQTEAASHRLWLARPDDDWSYSSGFYQPPAAANP